MRAHLCSRPQERLHPEAGPPAGALAGRRAAGGPAAFPGGRAGQTLAPVPAQPEEAAEVPVGHADPRAARRPGPLQPAAAPALPAGAAGEKDNLFPAGNTFTDIVINIWAILAPGEGRLFQHQPSGFPFNK